MVAAHNIQRRVSGPSGWPTPLLAALFCLIGCCGLFCAKAEGLDEYVVSDLPADSMTLAEVSDLGVFAPETDMTGAIANSESPRFPHQERARGLVPMLSRRLRPYAAGERLPGGRWRPRWTAQVDSLLLWEGNIPTRPLYLDAASQATALDANDAPPAVSAGPRFGLILHGKGKAALEGNFFTVQSFQGDASLPVTAGAYEEFQLAGLNFIDIDTAALDTDGSLKSAELNWRYRQGPLTWLAGFRWVEWNQGLSVNDVASLTGDTSEVAVLTLNDLYGGQLGADLVFWNRGEAICVNGVAKAGVFYNHATQRTRAEWTDLLAPNLVTVTSEAEQTAFFGEVGVTAGVKLRPWLTWRAGYTVFWLSGIASPAQQLSLVDVRQPTPESDISTGQSALIHGVTTGLEAHW